MCWSVASLCGPSTIEEDNLPAVEGDARLGGVLLQLVVGSGSEGVGAHQARSPALLHVVVGHLCAGGRLSGTLQTDEHDDVGFALDGREGLDAGVHQLPAVRRWMASAEAYRGEECHFYLNFKPEMTHDKLTKVRRSSVKKCRAVA